MHVETKSAWPNFRCMSCTQPTSLAVFENVGASEIFLLVIAGIMPAAGLILTFVYQQPTLLKVIAGVFAVPLALPWVANGLANMLAASMPAMLNASAPAGRGMRFQLAAAREFKLKPLGYRLRKVYAFYVMHTIPAMIFCILALLFIDWIVTHVHSLR